jgi:hypothetical protein
LRGDLIARATRQAVGAIASELSLITRHDGRRIAANIAKLPELVRK